MNRATRTIMLAVRVSIMIVLVIVGLLLLPRPLTSVSILLGVLTAMPVLVAAVLVRRRWGRAGPGALTLIAIAGLAGTILLALSFSAFACGLPWVLALAIVSGPAFALVRAIRARRSVAVWGVVFWLIGCLGAAALCVLWPDLATIAAGFATALAFIGVVFFWLSRSRSLTSRRGRRGRHPVLVLAAGIVFAGVALSVAGMSIGIRGQTARADAFYEYADPIPQPGTLLKSEEYSGDVPDGASALRVLYATTYSDGTPAVSSAVVVFPSTPAATPRPVMAWQHGTTGVAQSCAPSLRPDALSEAAIPGIGRALDRGWVVVATDYPGQGTGGRYPYLIGEGEARATWDAVRAAQSIDAAGASKTVLLWGHSQGGHATLWAGQIAADYAPEQHLVAVAALSAASDPLAEAKAVMSAGTISRVVAPYLLVPYADEYSDISLEENVHPAGQGIVEAMASRCAFDQTMIASVLSAAALAQDVPLFTIDLAEGAAHDRLAQNIADGLVPAPLFLGQGVDDEVISIRMQRTLAASLQAAGRDVEVHEYPGRTHMGVIASDSPLIDDLFAWTDAILTSDGAGGDDLPE